MEESIITIPCCYGWVLLSVVVIAIECWLVGGFVVMPARTKAFNKEFMKSTFGEEHKSEIGGEVSSAGYPDMGCGKYAEKLPYKDWYQFNNAQRCHYNFVENLTIMVVCLLVGGLKHPSVAAALGLVYAISRVFYIFGYSRGGPSQRIFGAAVGFFAGLAIMVLALYASYLFTFHKHVIAIYNNYL